MLYSIVILTGPLAPVVFQMILFSVPVCQTSFVAGDESEIKMGPAISGCWGAGVAVGSVLCGAGVGSGVGVWVGSKGGGVAVEFDTGVGEGFGFDEGEGVGVGSGVGVGIVEGVGMGVDCETVIVGEGE